MPRKRTLTDDERKQHQSAANIAWDKENTVAIRAKLNRNTDQDIIQKIETVDNVAGYIKALIRADINK